MIIFWTGISKESGCHRTSNCSAKTNDTVFPLEICQKPIIITAAKTQSDIPREKIKPGTIKRSRSNVSIFLREEALLPQNWKKLIFSLWFHLIKVKFLFSQNVARQFVCQGEIRAQKSALYQIQTANDRITPMDSASSHSSEAKQQRLNDLLFGLLCSWIQLLESVSPLFTQNFFIHN